MERPVIRQLTEEDAEAYRALRLRLRRVSPDAYAVTYDEDAGQPVARTAERLRAQRNPEGGFTRGTFTPELVGMVTVVRDDLVKLRHKAHVFAMGVAEEARGRGIGRALMEEAVARAKQLAGLEQVLLTVVLPNEPARRLYHSLGFVTFGIDERGLKLGDQYWDEEQLVLAL
jgi:ribosomal protein S18 acetylase RimI-like enzyme